jgi:hypothetical protein
MNRVRRVRTVRGVSTVPTVFLVPSVLVLAVIGTPSSVSAQDDVLAARVMAAVRAVVAPALPFPPSDDLGSLPADGKAHDPWMVKPLQPGDRTIEVLANPLNEAHQRRATRAMAEIEQSIEAAQRRADLQYERAVAEAKRTGRSQDVDGVTLSDEGLAGARIDAESHVTIEISLNEPAPDGVTITSTPSGVYQDDHRVERFREAQSTVQLGRVNSSPHAGLSSLAIRLRGNETLIADLLRKSDWNSLLELLK